MSNEPPYHIGQADTPWGQAEREQWLSEQIIQRSYQQLVVEPLAELGSEFQLRQYGALDYNPERYSLFAATSQGWQASRPTALITGGVHGYETSGVLGALRFLLVHARDYATDYNLIIAPCISPWAFETINRWNPQAVDPNRSFVSNSSAQESAALMALVASTANDIYLHIDLHETTDTDNSEFRPALAARDNVHHDFWEIPDGFYLVGDTENPCHEFQTHIIDAVRQVTHIAPSDASGRIIGEPTTQDGVINYATQKLGLCTGFSHARYNTTTEVYPDSPNVDDENCIAAQVVAVNSGLEFALDAWS